MNAGTLNFVLGLNAGSFLGPLNTVAGRLAAITGGILSFGTVVKGVFDAIERGGKLTDLRARTGATEADLYSLQEAFAVVGVEANALPGMIIRLQKSMSGVGEMGEKTSEAFAAMGLNIEQLKRMNAPAQFNAILTALSGMDRNSAVDVASRIFGREGAGNIVQLAGDAQGFRETLADAAREAAVFGRNAAAFDKLGDTFTRIKGQLGGMFAGIAESLVPTLQSLADALKELDLVSVGQNIGTMFTGAFQAFREGRISELIAESIIAGFQAAVMVIPGIFAELGMVILKVLETPLTYIQTFYDFMVGNIAQLASKIPGLKDLDQGGFMTWQQAQEERQAQGLEFFTPGNTLESMREGMQAYWADAKNRLGQIGGDLFGSFSDFAARAAKGSTPVTASGFAGDGEAAGVFGGSSKLSGSSLEKMGFIMGGSRNSELNEMKRMNKTLSKIEDKISPNQPVKNR